MGRTSSLVLKPGLEAVELDGKTWGVPISVGNHLMLLYNKKLIAAPLKNTDEMIKVAKELTRDPTRMACLISMGLSTT